MPPSVISRGSFWLVGYVDKVSRVKEYLMNIFIEFCYDHDYIQGVGTLLNGVFGAVAGPTASV